MTDIGRSRRLWRRAFFILLGAFAIVCVALVIASTHRTVSYAEQSPSGREDDMDVLLRFVAGEQPTATRSAVLRTLRRQNPKARILATDSTLSIGRLVFRFGAGDRLEEVMRVP